MSSHIFLKGNIVVWFKNNFVFIIAFRAYRRDTHRLSICFQYLKIVYIVIYHILSFKKVENKTRSWFSTIYAVINYIHKLSDNNKFIIDWFVYLILFPIFQSRHQHDGHAESHNRDSCFRNSICHTRTRILSIWTRGNRPFVK